MKTDVVIIGNGLIGGMTAKYLRDVKGMEVVIIDNKNPLGASKCSFGVWKEGWVNQVIQAEYQDGLDILDAFTGGVKDIEMLVKPKPYNHMASGAAKYEIRTGQKLEMFKRVDCKLLLNEPAINATLLSIDKNRVSILHTGSEQKKELIVAKYIIIAAGVWTTDILTENGLIDNLPYLDHQWGTVFTMKGNKELPLPKSQMREWSPYKQSVFINNGDGTGVFGDGVTVKNPKKDDPRQSIASDRLLIHMNELLSREFAQDGKQTILKEQYGGCIVDILEGYRPYLNKKKSSTGKFVNQHSEWVFSATGGAKNSTVLAGHMAKSLYRLFKG